MGLDKIYRALLLVCAVYFIAVALAHQSGVKLPMLFVFYKVPSERCQDLIISFLSFGWAMLFGIGFFDGDLKIKVHIPILLSGLAAICGLIRARRYIRFPQVEIDVEIAALAIVLLMLLAAYIVAAIRKRGAHRNPNKTITRE